MRAIIIERWAILRQGLRAVLREGGYPVLSAAATGAEGLESIRTARKLELVVVGHTDDLDAVHLVAAVAEASPDARVLVLTDRADRRHLRRLLSAGADGVLGRLSETQGLLDALARLERGERVLSNEVIMTLVGSLEEGEAPPARLAAGNAVLTAREQEVLLRLATGASNRELADDLFIGEATVKSHLVSIYAKLEVPNRHRAVARALELGLLGSPAG